MSVCYKKISALYLENTQFQYDYLDIIRITLIIDITINLLQRQYLGINFGRTSSFLEKFLSKVVPIDQTAYIDRHGLEKGHTFHYKSMSKCHVEGSLEKCMILRAQYVHRVIDSLNDHFFSLSMFNATMLFSPQYHALNDLIKHQQKCWSQRTSESTMAWCPYRPLEPSPSALASTPRPPFLLVKVQ